MKKTILIILFIAYIFVPFFGAKATSAKNNRPTVKAQFSTDTIMIGDQPTLRITITKDVSQKVYFPDFDKELAQGLEMLFQGKIDTTRVEGSREITLTRDYVVTSFDAGEYKFDGVPVFEIVDEKTDTLYSAPINLVVNTYAIDTLTQQIFDIKEPIQMPLTLSEIVDYIYLGLLILAIAAIIVLIVTRLCNKESMFSRPKLPPHVIAVSELQKIKDMELWQQGKHKEYYTMLTDTVREYLEGRFGKKAMEMTTEEIMVSIKEDTINEKDRDMLYELLSLADLVKFAKYVPDKNDNEISFVRAYEFVEHTKGAEESEITTEETLPAEQQPKAEKQDERKEEQNV